MTKTASDRLAALRQAMQQHGVAACIIPSADPHLSEYLPGHWAAREWLSGFTGSAGTLLVTADHAGLWTDSRYFSQAESQLAGSGIALMKQKVSYAPEHLQWLQQHLAEGDVVAVAGDSVSLSTQRQIARLLAATAATVRTDLDLPGQIWPDRPALPKAPIFEHPGTYASVSRADKLNRLRASLRQQGATHHLVSSLDDIAWLTNLRGSDVECNPVFLAHLLVRAQGHSTLFVDRGKLDDATVAALARDEVRVADYATAVDELAELGADDTLLFDPGRVVAAIAAASPPPVKQLEGANPSTAFKARKTAAELDHISDVMRRDGVALVRAFRRLEERLAAGMTQSELDVETLLREERAAQADFIGESFATIAGYQANGALPHYRATPEAHSTLQRKGLLLVDSGGQYLGGTTDITRVLALGETTAEQRRDATLVMKGMIAPVPRPLPRRCQRPAAGRAGARAAVGQRHGLRPRHRPRRGLLPQRARRSARHPPAVARWRTGAAGAGHDHLDRTGAVQTRPPRHPPREPGGGGGSGPDRVRRLPGLRDTDPVPVRPSRTGAGPAQSGRTRLAGRLPRHRARRAGAIAGGCRSGVAGAALRAVVRQA